MDNKYVELKNTLNYYNNNATSFALSTVTVDFQHTQDRFLSFLPINAFILYFGCGSGRDMDHNDRGAVSGHMDCYVLFFRG